MHLPIGPYLRGWNEGFDMGWDACARENGLETEDI